MCEGVAMGRGRAKAKQTKVARELKYSSPSTDYDALQRELASGASPYASRPVEAETAEPETDEYEDDYPDWASGSR
jgi:hypothetical protein